MVHRNLIGNVRLPCVCPVKRRVRRDVREPFNSAIIIVFDGTVRIPIPTTSPITGEAMSTYINWTGSGFKVFFSIKTTVLKTHTVWQYSNSSTNRHGASLPSGDLLAGGNNGSWRGRRHTPGTSDGKWYRTEFTNDGLNNDVNSIELKIDGVVHADQSTSLTVDPSGKWVGYSANAGGVYLEATLKNFKITKLDGSPLYIPKSHELIA